MSALTVTNHEGKLAPIVLLPGEHVIEVGAPGYAAGRTTVNVGTSSKQSVKIVLKKP
jgi:hypothetical protein